MPLSIIGFKHPVNSRLNKILVAAKFAGIDVAQSEINVFSECETHGFKMNCHPLGRHPVLQTEEGYLFESNAIMRYLARQDKSGAFLYGRTNYESSQVDMWLDFAQCELVDLASPFLGPVFFGAPRDAAKEAEAIEKACVALDGLERWLENRTFLVGERITIADICVAFSLDHVLRFNTSPDTFKKFKNVLRLYHTVMNQPKTVEVLRGVGAEIGLTNTQGKKEEKPAAAAKPAPAPKAAAKPAADDDEEEEAEAPKKKTNPLDLLPPSTFVLDEFKREYSNKDTRTVAAPFFFAKFDPAGWSVYWCRYKYNSDLTMQFMTANLIRGWFQRMDHVRKYAFGSVLIVGEERKHEIVGMWVFRGHGIPEIVNEVEDTELFDWTPADVATEQAKITDYLAQDGPTIGGEVLEGRVYK